MIKKNLALIKVFKSLPINKIYVDSDILKEKIHELIEKEKEKEKETYRDFDTKKLSKLILTKILKCHKGTTIQKLHVSLKGLIIHVMKPYLKKDSKFILDTELKEGQIYKWVIDGEKLIYSKKFKEDHSGLSKVFHTDLTDEQVCDYAGEFKYSDGKILFNLDSGRFNYKLNKGMILNQKDLKIIKELFKRILGDNISQAEDLFNEFIH